MTRGSASHASPRLSCALGSPHIQLVFMMQGLEPQSVGKEPVLLLGFSIAPANSPTVESKWMVHLLWLAP